MDGLKDPTEPLPSKDQALPCAPGCATPRAPEKPRQKRRNPRKCAASQWPLPDKDRPENGPHPKNRK